MIKDLNDNIRDIEKSIEIISKVKTQYKGKVTYFWLGWYTDFLSNIHECYLEVIKTHESVQEQDIPKEHLRELYKRFILVIGDTLSKITKNEKLVLNDVILPQPTKDYEKELFLHFIIDSLFTYLLRELDEIDLIDLLDLYPFYSEGAYEYKDVRLEAGDIVIDAGASIGEFSALASTRGCISYAFEPIPQVVDTYLSKTAKWNPNIHINRFALSDKCGDVVIECDPENFVISTYVNAPERNTSKVHCQSVTIDKFTENESLPRIDFIKADIEGAERHLISGAREVLMKYAPKISICKYHLPDDPIVLRNLILDANPNYIIEERWMKMFAYIPKI